MTSENMAGNPATTVSQLITISQERLGLSALHDTHLRKLLIFMD